VELTSIRNRSFARARAAATTHFIIGLTLLAGVSITAWHLHRLVPALPLPTMTLFLGVAVGSACALSPALRHLRPAAEVPLAVGMVLLGAQCDVVAVHTVGFVGIALLLLHWWIAGRILRYALERAGESKRTASLVSVGSSGAGISAVLAAESSDPESPPRARLLAESSDPESPPRARLLAVASTLVTGALGFVLLPLVASSFWSSATTVARLSGIAMPTTAEAVLIGAAHSPEALRGTGAFRFVVNLLQWIPVLGHARRFAPREERGAARSVVRTAAAVARRMPGFVWGLTLLAAVGTLGGFADHERRVLANVTNWAFLGALAGVGFAIRPLEIAALGWRPIVAAVIGWLAAATILLGAVIASSRA